MQILHMPKHSGWVGGWVGGWCELHQSFQPPSDKQPRCQHSVNVIGSALSITRSLYFRGANESVNYTTVLIIMILNESTLVAR